MVYRYISVLTCSWASALDFNHPHSSGFGNRGTFDFGQGNFHVSAQFQIVTESVSVDSTQL